jgi:hypothetical protein
MLRQLREILKMFSMLARTVGHFARLQGSANGVELVTHVVEGIMIVIHLNAGMRKVFELGTMNASVCHQLSIAMPKW